MYALYKQTHPPSGVEHCIYCNFYSAKECNLVVVGTTQLRIYKLYYQTEVSSLGSIETCFDVRIDR
jgi:cleavage and polyadenylation specificity factor subunit 1